MAVPLAPKSSSKTFSSTASFENYEKDAKSSKEKEYAFVTGTIVSTATAASGTGWQSISAQQQSPATLDAMASAVALMAYATLPVNENTSAFDGGVFYDDQYLPPFQNSVILDVEGYPTAIVPPKSSRSQTQPTAPFTATSPVASAAQQGPSNATVAASSSKYSTAESENFDETFFTFDNPDFSVKKQDALLVLADLKKLQEKCPNIDDPSHPNILNALIHLSKTFSVGQTAFPTWICWSFMIYKLLKDRIPSEAEKWIAHIVNSKMAYLESKELESLAPESFDYNKEITIPLSQEDVRIRVRLIELCYDPKGKIKPDFQLLLDYLAGYQFIFKQASNVTVAVDPDPSRKLGVCCIKDQTDYNNILECIAFVDRFSRKGRKPTQSCLFQLATSFSPNLKDITKDSAYVSKMVCTYGAISAAYQDKLLEIYTLNKKNGVTAKDFAVASVVGTSLNKTKRGINALNTALRRFKDTRELFFNAIHMSVIHDAYSSLYNRISEAVIAGVKMQKPGSEMLEAGSKESAGIDLNTPLIRKVFINEYADWSGDAKNLKEKQDVTRKSLRKALKCIQTCIATHAIDRSLQKALENVYNGIVAIMNEGPSHLSINLGLSKNYFNGPIPRSLLIQNMALVHYFRSDLKNLDAKPERLNDLRAQVLDVVVESFKTIPPEILSKHSKELHTCICELHVIASRPVIEFLELLFFVARLRGDNQFIKVGDFKSLPPERLAKTLVEFLSLEGLKEKLRKSTASKKKVKADISVVEVSKELFFAKLPVLAPSGKSFEETAIGPTRKQKRAAVAAAKAAVASKESATKTSASAATASSTTAAATASVSNSTSSDDTYVLVPKKRDELIDLLNNHGYSLLREGHSHSIFYLEGKDTIPVPRHKTIATGTMHAIKKQIVVSSPTH